MWNDGYGEREGQTLTMDNYIIQIVEDVRPIEAECETRSMSNVQA